MMVTHTFFPLLFWAWLELTANAAAIVLATFVCFLSDSKRRPGSPLLPPIVEHTSGADSV